MKRRTLPLVALFALLLLIGCLVPLAGTAGEPRQGGKASIPASQDNPASRTIYSESEGNDAYTTANAFTAGSLGNPASISGVLSTVSDMDWFKLTVTGTDPGYLNASLRTPPDAGAIDYEVQVFEPNDATASKDFMYASDSGYVNELPTAATCWAAGPGYYFMRVQIYSGSAVSALNYWLNVSFEAQPGMNVEDELINKTFSNDISADADPFTVTGPGALKELTLFGTARSADDEDWYMVNLTGASAGRLNVSFEAFWRDVSGSHGSHYLTFDLFGPLPSGTADTDKMLTGSDYGSAGVSVYTAAMAPAASYWLKVYDATDYSFSPFEPYRVYINFTPAKALDPNIQLEADLLNPVPSDNSHHTGATSITLTDMGTGSYNGTAWGTLLTDTDADWFQANIPGSSRGDLYLEFDTPYDSTFGLNPYYDYAVFRADNMTKEHLNATNLGSAGAYTDTLQAVRTNTYYIRVLWMSGSNSATRREPYMLHLSFTPNTALPVEQEHLDDTLNNDTASAEAITMLAPGGGRSYHLGEIYGSLSNATDQDFYTFEFTDTYSGDFRIYVRTPNHFPNTYYTYDFYGPDGLTHPAAAMSQYGTPSEQQVSPTIQGGLPGSYLLHVHGSGYYDPGHLYYVRIEFEPKDTSTYQIVGNIYGKALNNFTDQPVQNATITIEGLDQYSQWQPWGAYVTDINGDYSTSDLPRQDVRIHVLTNGYRELTVPVTMVDADINKDLRLDPTFGNLQGTVYADNSQPIAFAKIEVLGTPLWTESATDGTYSFSNIPTGYYNVRFSAKDHYTYTTNTQVIESETTTLNAYLTRMTGNLKIFVKDEAGENVTDASVSVWRQYLGTFPAYYNNFGDHSAYYASNLLIGNWSVLVTVTDHAPVNITVEVRLAQTVSINVSLANMSFTLEIRDIDTSSYLTSSSIYVSLYRPDKQNATLTSTSQAYTYKAADAYWDSSRYLWKFSSPPLGEYLLNITDRYWSVEDPSLEGKYIPHEESILVEAANIHRVINMSKPGFRVRLTDAQTKEPVTTSSVTLTSDADASDSYTLTNQWNGIYQYSDVVPFGEYTLSIEDSNYKPHVEQVTVEDISTFFEIQMYKKQMSIDVVPAALYSGRENRVIVTVTDNDTLDPVQGVTVTHSLMTGWEYYSTDSDGRVELVITPTVSTVTVTATKNDYFTVSKVLSVIDSAVTSGFLAGTVRDWDNNPIPGLELELYDISDFGETTWYDRLEFEDDGPDLVMSATTDSSGRYSFQDIEFAEGGDYWTQEFLVMAGKYQDYRVGEWGFYQKVEFTYAYWSRSMDLRAVENNEVDLEEERTPTGDIYDPYKNKVYPAYELTDDGHRFRVWVKDRDGDEPEYVKVVIDEKEFTMRPMKGFDSAGDSVEVPISSGRYYEVLVEDSELDSGEYEYSFEATDSWQSDPTELQGDGTIEIKALRDIILKSNLVILAVMGVIFFITLIMFIIAKVKSRKYSYEVNNKELTVDALGHYMSSLDLPPDESGTDLNEARKQFIQGKIGAKEFIQKLK